MKNEKKILKWLDQEFSESEIQDLKQTESFETLEKIAFYSSQMQPPRVDADAALVSFKSRSYQKSKAKVRSLNFKVWFSAAAAILVLIGASYFLFLNTDTSFETHIAENTTIYLPDNSEVLLNANSKISYNSNSWKVQRSLNLVGEAYFKVQKGQTFSVRTPSGIVQVLGTQFNIKERNNYFEVHCYEGLVSVTFKNKTVKLAAGKNFRVLNGSIEYLEDSNAPKPSWTEKESSFNRIPLNQVLDELERQYDIQIKTEGIDTQKLFTGSFTNTNQKIALESISIPLKLSYKIEGKTIIFYNYNAK